MSDFVPRNILPDLWQSILETHWSYLETEESIVKLENRKKLEDSLKEFLYVVQHDRKFMLAETTKVLGNSVRDLENFSAQKGITAFESINQYANNLFTKPWRKEFRVLKLYSGFYQHEIRSNLLDAEMLFEAMGYRRLTEDTLILDGPICPDQVANVSRDALIAYAELQIIKHIYTGLDTIGIKCSWLDIYRHREISTGSTSQAIKAIANSFFEEKRYRGRQKLLLGDNYGYIDVQPSLNYSQFCTAECQCSSIYQLSHQMSRQRPISRTNGVCCVPEQQKQSFTATNLVYSNMPYSGQQHNQHHHQHHSGMPTENGGALLSHMTHSRSLEHYSEHPNHYNNLLPHRHSFDHQDQGCTAHPQYHNSQQQQYYYQHINKMQHNLYESPYDCLDGNSLGGGSSNISYAAVAANVGTGASTIGVGNGRDGDGVGVGATCNFNSNSTYCHPYNVSGNRFPLPLNISTQLFNENSQSNSYNGIQEPTYAQCTDQNIYSLKSKVPQNFAKNTSLYNHPNNNQSSQNPRNPLLVKDFHKMQRSCQSEQLINFDDASALPPSVLQHEFDPLYQCPNPNYDTANHTMDKHFNMRSNIERSLPSAAASAIGQQDCGPCKPLINDETYVYAKPIPRESRKQNALSARKYAYNTDTTDISYDSPNDDFVNVPSTESERNHQSPSAPQSTKNQDGVGSVELWTDVYQNVENKGYSSKEFDERTDFLVNSLDLDAMNINNDTAVAPSSSTDKRRSFCSGIENKTAQQHEEQKRLEPKKSKAFENAKYLTKTNLKLEKGCRSSITKNIQKQKSLGDNNTKRLKPTPKPYTNVNRSQSKSNDNKFLSKTAVNNNNNDLTDISRKGSAQQKKSYSPSSNTGKRAPSVASTQIIVTSANEWSCHFCTFINPDSKRICEMCSHTKDFEIDSSSSAAAGTITMAQNTPTCV